MINETATFRIVADERVDKAHLKELAIALEAELQKDALLSKDVAAFAAYPPLVSAIQRAKDELIENPEEIPNTQYWNFETTIRDYEYMHQLFSKFCLALKCWRIIEEFPSENRDT